MATKNKFCSTPGCPSLSASMSFFRPCMGTITRLPHSKHSSTIPISCLLLKYRRHSSVVGHLSGYPFFTEFITCFRSFSFFVHLAISWYVTRVWSRYSNSMMFSSGMGTSSSYAWNKTNYMYKMDLALNNLQRWIYYKPKQTNPKPHTHIHTYTNICLWKCFFLCVDPKREKSKYFKISRLHKRFISLKNYLFPSYIRVCFELVAFIREYLVIFLDFCLDVELGYMNWTPQWDSNTFV